MADEAAQQTRVDTTAALSRRRFMLTAACAATICASPSEAAAKLLVFPKGLLPSTPIGSGEFVSAPAQWLRMIQSFPNLHPGEAVLSPVPSTGSRETELKFVNRSVNSSVRFKAESRDFWQPAEQVGDCEDLALRKLVVLTEEFGWPRSALTLAVCRVERGIGHAVLLAHTGRGAYALDSRCTPVLPWRVLPYRWLSREAPGSPFGLWRTISL